MSCKPHSDIDACHCLVHQQLSMMTCMLYLFSAILHDVNSDDVIAELISVKVVGCRQVAGVVRDQALVWLLQVYTAEHSSQLFAVKLFRYSSSIDQGHQAPIASTSGAAVAGAAGASSTLGHPSNAVSATVQRETELEAVLSLQYRLCDLQHEHILQHVAVYPKVYEVRAWLVVFGITLCLWTLGPGSQHPSQQTCFG